MRKNLECSDLSELCGRDLSRRPRSVNANVHGSGFIEKSKHISHRGDESPFLKAVTSHRTPNRA